MLFFLLNNFNILNKFVFFRTFQDIFLLKTPGGGGYGVPNVQAIGSKAVSHAEKHHLTERGSVFEYRQAQESA